MYLYRYEIYYFRFCVFVVVCFLTLRSPSIKKLTNKLVLSGKLYILF